MATFNYNLSITGDCSNTNNGIINLSLLGGTPPYTIQWQSPLTQVDLVTTGASIVTGLSASTYTARVNDSTLPINKEFYINVPVSSGVCTSIVSVQDTTCNSNNGSVVATSTSQYSSTNFYLLGMDNSLIQSGVSVNTPNFTFGDLSASTYFIIAEDLGGCSGMTQSFIIDTS